MGIEDFVQKKIEGTRQKGAEKINQKIEESGKEKAEELMEYHEETEVNGIKIIVWFDNGYQNYVLLFPQIKTDEEINDSLFMIDKNPENAKKVYDYAVGLAEEEENVRDLYKKAEEFTSNLLERE